MGLDFYIGKNADLSFASTPPHGTACESGVETLASRAFLPPHQSSPFKGEEAFGIPLPLYGGGWEGGLSLPGKSQRLAIPWANAIGT